jgi:two-component sensor histidine kinase
MEGFGLHLVAMLAQQLDGTLEIERHSGARFVIEFNE